MIAEEATADAKGIPSRAPEGPADDQFMVVPLRHYGRWAAAIAIVVAVATVIYAFAQADIDYGIIPDQFTSSIILDGLRGTILLTLGAMAIGVSIGVLVAVLGQSENVVLRIAAMGYIWLFRGTPALVQLLIWFNLALVVEHIHIPLVFDGQTNELITPLVAGLLGLGLSESAVMAEIIRGGMISVGKGQLEASKALGMRPLQTMWRIILPQAIRVIIPPTGNEFITMLKYSSLAFAVSYQELLSSATQIYTNNLKVVELLLTVTIWYLLLTTLLTFVQHALEKRFSRSLAAESSLTLGARLRRGISLRRRS